MPVPGGVCRLVTLKGWLPWCSLYQGFEPAYVCHVWDLPKVFSFNKLYWTKVGGSTESQVEDTVSGWVELYLSFHFRKVFQIALLFQDFLQVGVLW